MNLGVALVSGGLDSCVTAASAAREVELAFLHLNYRQRTERRELAAFTALADYFGAAQRLVVDITYMHQIGGSSLIDERMPVPKNFRVKIETAKCVLRARRLPASAPDARARH